MSPDIDGEFINFQEFMIPEEVSMFQIFERQPQIGENRFSKPKHLKVLLSLLASVLLSLAPAQVQAAPSLTTPGCRSTSSQTIDFSAAGEGTFQPDFFKSLVITQGDFVGYVQGDQSLIGPVAGTFHPSVCSISVRVAPAFQGTAAYTLSAYSASGKVVGSTTMTVTQDIGEAESGPIGYFVIELTGLSQKAQTFTLENQFIRSSFPQTTQISFGVSSITYTAR
jgi:hypothetical protein